MINILLFDCLGNDYRAYAITFGPIKHTGNANRMTMIGIPRPSVNNLVTRRKTVAQFVWIQLGVIGVPVTDVTADIYIVTVVQPNSELVQTQCHRT